MNYSLFFYKGSKELSPSVVPIYQFLYMPEYEEVVGVGYHNKTRSMCIFEMKDILPVEALSKDSEEVVKSIGNWNKKNPKNKVTVVRRLDSEALKMHCSFDIVLEQKDI